MRLDAVARLERVAITTFEVDPAALSARLPPTVDAVRLRPAPDEELVSLVSAVSFHVRGLRVRALPWPQVSCGHVDFRAYLEGGTVWFLDAAMDSALGSLPRRVWGMPWRRARVAVEIVDGVYRLAGEVALAARPAPEPLTALRGFDTLEAAVDALVNPSVGLFLGRGEVACYEVVHDPLRPVLAEATTLRFAAFDGLGARLHSVLLLPDFDITIRLPPRAWNRLGSTRGPLVG